MPLIYSSVSKERVTLAEYAAFSGNFSAVAKDYLAKAGRQEGNRCVFCIDGHSFNFLTQGGFTYLAVADEAYGRTVPVAFLDKVASEFAAKYAEKAALYPEEGSLNGTFGKQLKQLMAHATQYPAEYSRMAAVQQKVDAVRGIMADNIQAVLNNSEKVERIADKSENLTFEAERFVRTSRTIQRKVWWQNCKMKLAVALGLVLLAVVIFLLVCFSGGNCLK